MVVVARLVVPVAVGREGSKRSVVAAAGVMVVQRRRWARTELTGGREGSKMGSRRLIMAAAKIMAVQPKRFGLLAPSDGLTRKSGLS